MLGGGVDVDEKFARGREGGDSWDVEEFAGQQFGSVPLQARVSRVRVPR